MSPGKNVDLETTADARICTPNRPSQMWTSGISILPDVALFGGHNRTSGPSFDLTPLLVSARIVAWAS